ncbi:hypothetical protein PLESTF_000427800 [Pleodorina starrii]|nr:hypothetical protein PLESTM_001465200 [Pleodorina starrii]GLC66442.1 hypothetical protein PLESTF_000427800 [Pleodorina starrii]
MGLLTLVSTVTRELLCAAFGVGRKGAAAKSPRKHVGVITAQLTQLQARCLLAACAFWAVVSVIALPSVLVFGLLLVPIWVTAEVAFLFWWFAIYRRLNAQPVPHRPPAHNNPRDVFDRFIRDQKALSRYINIMDMISKWHWDVPISQLTRGNVADLLCYGFYYRSPQQLADEGLGHLPDQLVSELEAAWGVTFSAGPYVPRRLMTHLWEPVRCFPRPLAFYAGVEVLIALKHVMLQAAGFRAHMHQGLRYYTYGLPAPASSSSSATPPSHHNPSPSSQSPASVADAATPSAAAAAPILFLHGVGLGLLPYLNFLLRLSSLGRPVLAVEVRHLSMRACTEVPEEDEVVAAIAGAMAAHGVRHVHAVAHSYGTFMASRLVHLHRPAVASLTLVDPVCFVMFSGKLIHNFVYRNPLQGASAITWFIARDLAHAVSVSRRFYWSLLNLWPDQLPDHTLVSLSAQDELVPVQEVLTMLQERPSTRVLLHDAHRHADFIKDLPWQATMVQHVAELIQQASAAAAAAAPDAGSDSEAMEATTKPTAAAQQQLQPGSSAHARSDSASSYEVGRLGPGPKLA